jgi:hypothetical protein
MKIAVICVGYLGSARGVELLAGYFSRADADIWLHIDSATDAAEYYALAERYSQVRLVSPRLRYWWGGFNAVRAVLSAAAAARAAKRYDRYLFLTEDSTPLRSVDELTERLSQDLEYIEISDGTPFRARYEGFYCWDCDAMNPRVISSQDWSVDGWNMKSVTPELERQIARMAQLRARGKARVARLWYGYGYWALSAAAITTLLNRHQSDEHLRESFEFSAIPEEQYYHTILRESSHAMQTSPFMFMDFSGDPRPFVYRTRQELARLRKRPHLFARKIDFYSPEVAEFYRELSGARRKVNYSDSSFLAGRLVAAIRSGEDGILLQGRSPTRYSGDLQRLRPCETRYLCYYPDVLGEYLAGSIAPNEHYERHGRTELRTAPEDIIPIGFIRPERNGPDMVRGEVVRFTKHPEEDLTRVNIGLWIECGDRDRPWFRFTLLGEVIVAEISEEVVAAGERAIILAHAQITMTGESDPADIALALMSTQGDVLAAWAPEQSAEIATE